MFIKALCTFDSVHLVSSNYGSTEKTKFRRTCKKVYKTNVTENQAIPF
jgi:hypothetical protein